MNKIYVTSDLHFGHDKPFIVQDRGYTSVEEHDGTLVKNWNMVVDCDDDVYLLGDVTVGDNESGITHLSELNGRIHIIRGNHDTEEKMKRYLECQNVVEILAAKYLNARDLGLGSFTFYMSHYPTIVSHDSIKKMKNAIINLYGHTHQKDNFYTLNGEYHPYMYHVGVDSHNLRPVPLEDIINDVRAQKNDYDGRHQEFNDIVVNERISTEV